MPATLTDLTRETDAYLDAGLKLLYAQHHDADDAGRAECHGQIMAVLGEMSRRLDAWLAGREIPRAAK